MDQLDTFISQIIDEKNLPGITEEVKQSLIEDLKMQMLDRIDHALLEKLTDEQLDEFTEQVQQSDDKEFTERYLSEHGVDVEKVTARTMLAFRDLYLESPQERQES
ncbi:hypothetical protein H7100_03710 [Candidatus Saccharibacteria bacterium]|nr:hypothetical protein [Candidatus Saccharibacteria bacterium]